MKKALNELWYNICMRIRKDGKPDKRFKKSPKEEELDETTIVCEGMKPSDKLHPLSGVDLDRLDPKE
ncbi:MAG: hypothetical protein GY861_03330 [bacterium]|nr:hypothetical protein [bacterium]